MDHPHRYGRGGRLIAISTEYSQADQRPIQLTRPTIEHGGEIRALIRACPPLDVNSTYAYLLLAHHFAETCILAWEDGRAVGFVSAYVPPRREDTLFVWQVAVHPDARGRGLGKRMLLALLKRKALSRITRIETTVSPGNGASRAMFAALARALDARIEERPLFTPQMFGTEHHEEERLLVIGPIQKPAEKGEMA
ncbi:MAG: diaminobutyrate acetyltransferase [Pseudomonadota bacterium]